MAKVVAVTYIVNFFAVLTYALVFQSNEVFSESAESMYLLSKNEYLDALLYLPSACHSLLFLLQVRSLNSSINRCFAKERGSLLVGKAGYQNHVNLESS